MSSRLIIRQNVRDQDALVDLQAILVALQRVLFRSDLRPLGRKPRKRFGGSKQKLLHAHEALQAPGDRAVDRARVRAQKAIARLARASLDRLYGLLLCWRP